MFNQSARALIVLLTSTIATIATAASPRDAAFASSADPPQSRGLLFSGATMQIDLAPGASQPRLGLRFAGGRKVDGGITKIADGIALSAARHGNAKLTVNGEDGKAVVNRLRRSDADLQLIGIGLTILVPVVLAIIIASSENKNGGAADAQP